VSKSRGFEAPWSNGNFLKTPDISGFFGLFGQLSGGWIAYLGEAQPLRSHDLK
jgi:hypothetical protein